MNFPRRTAFAVSHKFWVVVSSFPFVSRKFLISSLISFLTHSLYNSMLFSLHDFECFGFFPLGLVSSFSPLWSENMLDNDFNFLEFVEACFVSYHVVYLWKCSMYTWKECVFCFFGVKSSLYISVKSISSRVLLSDTISLLIFCLEDQSIFDSGVLKSPTITVLLSISFLNSSKIFFMYLGAPMLGAYIFTMFLSSWWILSLSIIKLPSGSLFMALLWKSILSDMSIATPAFFFLSVCLEILFPAPYFQSV